MEEEKEKYEGPNFWGGDANDPNPEDTFWGPAVEAATGKKEESSESSDGSEEGDAENADSDSSEDAATDAGEAAADGGEVTAEDAGVRKYPEEAAARRGRDHRNHPAARTAAA